jgi:RNA polymerase primary sigma factor
MSLEDVMTETLEDRERTIVKEHYGLIKQTEITGQRKAKSLRQIAELLGLSKERVRKIELFALQKLRKVLTREQFDLLTQG